jgi:hypothetical protein
MNGDSQSIKGIEPNGVQRFDSRQKKEGIVKTSFGYV